MVRKHHNRLLTRAVRKYLSWAFLTAFVLFAAGINFLHTDGFFEKDPFCPACHFYSSLIEPAPVFLLPVPILAVLAVLPIATASSRDARLLVVEPARGPPLFS